MGKHLVFTILAMTLILAGCSSNFDVQPSGNIKPSTPSAALQDFTSSGPTQITTTRGYKANVAIGTAEKIKITGQRGYKAFISVQGNQVSN